MTEGIEPSSVGLTGLCSATELRHHLLALLRRLDSNQEWVSPHG